VKAASTKSAVTKSAALVAFVGAVLLGTAAPALAGTGATVADAQPWHYWLAFVLFASALGVALIALPVGYYKRVYRLKHPKK
jgi:thiosulfate reductase cytochrome b subunit